MPLLRRPRFIGRAGKICRQAQRLQQRKELGLDVTDRLLRCFMLQPLVGGV